MFYYVEAFFRMASHLDSQQWLYVLVVVVAVGLFTLRGFGSRSGY